MGLSMIEVKVDESIYTADYVEGCRALHESNLHTAIAALESVPHSSPCWIMAQGNIGLALLRLDRNEEAEEQLRQVLNDIDDRGCPYPPARLQFMRNLAEAIAKQGRQAEAIAELDRAMKVADKLAEDHSSLTAKIMCEKANVMNSCGMARLLQGEHSKAAAILNPS